MSVCIPRQGSTCNREWVFVFLDRGVIENECLYSFSIE